RPPAPSALYPLSLHDALPIFAGVREEPESWHHIDRFVSDETCDVVPRGLRTESCRHGENLDGRTRVVDQRVQDPPVKSRQLVFQDRKSTRLNSSHVSISYAVF